MITHIRFLLRCYRESSSDDDDLIHETTAMTEEINEVGNGNYWLPIYIDLLDLSLMKLRGEMALNLFISNTFELIPLFILSVPS